MGDVPDCLKWSPHKIVLQHVETCFFKFLLSAIRGPPQLHHDAKCFGEIEAMAMGVGIAVRDEPQKPKARFDT